MIKLNFQKVTSKSAQISQYTHKQDMKIDWAKYTHKNIAKQI